MINYRIYYLGPHGWEYINTIPDAEEIESYMKANADYTRIMIIKHTIQLDMDEVYLVDELYHDDIKCLRKAKKHE